jgi:hypothetical protein
MREGRQRACTSGDEVADAEERIASGQRRIATQRQVVAELERTRHPTDHAKYLLSGLELLQAAHRDARHRLLRELGKTGSPVLDESNERQIAPRPLSMRD